MEGAAASGWSRRANRITSPWRAVGGRLIADQGTLRFEPHGLDRALAAGSWRVAFDEVDSLTVAPRRPFSHLFGAGLRHQLCVEAGGQRTYFVVNGVGQVVDELRALMSAR